jgi:drug/metabolite transporter (DMT)-like permease
MATSLDQSAHTRPVAGALAAVAGVVMWGSFTVLARKVPELDGLGLAFHRIWLGAVVVVIALYVGGGRLSWNVLKVSAAGGVLFALDVSLFFTALKETTITNANIISSIQPILIALVVGKLFGERLNKGFFIWTAVAVAGVVVVILGSKAGNEGQWSLHGDVLALLATISWAGFFVASKQARKTLTSLEYLAGLLVVGFVAIAPITLLTGRSLHVDSWASWGYIAAIAVVSGGLGHWLMNWAHGHIPLAMASLLTLAIPVASVVTAVLVLDEAVGLQAVIGMAIVLAALAAVILTSPVDVEEAQLEGTAGEPGAGPADPG